jgi:hypothetical protein
MDRGDAIALGIALKIGDMSRVRSIWYEIHCRKMEKQRLEVVEWLASQDDRAMGQLAFERYKKPKNLRRTPMKYMRFTDRQMEIARESLRRQELEFYKWAWV